MHKEIDLKAAINRTVAWFCLLFILPLICSGVFANQSLEEQRALYSRAEQALKQGQRTLFLQQQDSLRDYPLYPYLLYLDMAGRLDSLKPETIANFLIRHEGTPIADKLRYKWLKHLAARNNRHLFAQYYRSNVYISDNALTCFHAQNLLHAGRLDELRDLVRQLWLVDFSQPPECDPVFLWGRQNGVIDQNLIWQRIFSVVKSGRLKLADYLAEELVADTRMWYVLLKESRHQPFEVLAKIDNYPAHSPFLHQVLLYSLSQARSQSLYKTHAIWQDLRRNFKSYPLLSERAAKGLGISACFQLEPEIGLHYLSSLANTDNDKNMYYWRIRCALRLQKWDTVLETIEALDYQDRMSSEWLYWKARALQQSGRNEEAIAIWESIASEASYHGYSAADRIGAPYALSTILPKSTAQMLNKVGDSAAMRRIYEFYHLARVADARRELRYLLPQKNKDERIAIALLCRQWGEATCAIKALAAQAFWHKELELRFPMPHRDIVVDQASRSKLPEYWAYAVMRRESAFMKDAKSSAGALGLMQLMPATARSTAKSLELNYSSRLEVLQPDLNLQLGTHYLKEMYLLNDRNWVSALASYNAGPHRVKRWRAKAPVYDTDIWIETVPFTETRRYLKAVLFYAVVYHYKLHGKTIRLRTLTATQ
ncbi:MAG: lytic transglycosylase domain-containing protein [Gammaproteobacteria bacterium]|nr:lytic transglycosylase domain-containing protein [Gammaproteobacteria bacterium]